MLGVFDVVTAVVAAVGYGIGCKRGLVWQLSGILTLVVGGACATILCQPLGPLILDGLLGRFVAWVGIYAVVAVCLYLLSLRLKHRLEDMELDELDERFGGMLGVFKALLVFGIIVLIAVGVSDRVAGAVRASASGRALHAVVHELRPYFPELIDRALQPRDSQATGPQPTEAQPAQAQPAQAQPTQAQPTRLQPPQPRRAQPSPTSAPHAASPAPHDPQAEPLHTPLPSPSLTPRDSAADPFDPHDLPDDPLAPPRKGSR
jgi:uncharacterized membrane protein required for colicin V production